MSEMAGLQKNLTSQEKTTLKLISRQNFIN